MEINDFHLGASTRIHEIEHPTKFPALDMLKESGGLPPMVHPVQSKQREFIDHTLLAPEYIRDSNHFIIDLIDQEVVFQKPTLSGATFVDKEQALNSDLQFQNAIFQFVNKHGQIQCAIPDDGVTIVGNDVTDASQSFNNKVQTNFLTLNESFLTDAAPNKSYNLNGPSDEATNNQFAPLMNTSLASICGDINPQNKASVSDLGLLGQEASSSSNLIQNSNLFCSGSNSRKVLPHKKRISKKLKGTENKSDFAFAAEELSDQSDKNQGLLIKQQKQTLMLFNCELCGHAASSQLAFFTHLKQHYEPETTVINLTVDETALNRIQQQKSFIENTRIQDKKEDHNNVTQVFPDVHINFEDFQQVHSSVVEVINHQSNKNDDIKILNSHRIDVSKCIDFVTQGNSLAPPKLVNTEEIEFSDTEDMLEGIRNVVDKVSIEDTCDALDMVTSNTMRSTWFANNSNFNGTSTLSSKLIENDNFSNSVTNQFACQKVTLSRLNEVTGSEGLPNFPGDSDCDKMDSPSTEATLSTSECDRKELEIYDQVSDSECVSDSKLSDDKMERRKYLCTQCNREFNSNNALKYHSRTHTGVRPHQCDVCGRSFFAQSALKAHIRTHTGDKPFNCEHCDQKFRQMGDLKYHVSSKHSANKSYQCEFCGKSFSRKYSLVLHRRIHTSERDYKCEFCPMTFRASIYLQNHRKIHTGEKPYQCETCCKKFRVSGDLKRHIRTHKNNKSKKKAKASST